MKSKYLTPELEITEFTSEKVLLTTSITDVNSNLDDEDQIKFGGGAGEGFKAR